MKTKSTIPYFILMHIAFLIYSFYSLCGKLASSKEFLSKSFIILYLLILLIMFIYAILWQQVLKKIPLAIASANKAVTIIWGTIFGKIIFSEKIKWNMIFGSVLILIGILILVTEKNKSTRKTNSL